MGITYSIYEAKARFSKMIRQVREGRSVTVSYHGKPVAEIKPIETQPEQTLEQRLRDLERRGVLVPAGTEQQPIAPIATRPGALARFLAERGE